MNDRERAEINLATVSFEKDGHREWVILSHGSAAVRERLPRHWASLAHEKKTYLIADQIKRLQGKLLRRIRNTQLRMAE